MFVVEVKPKRNIAVQDSEIFLPGYQLATANIQGSGWEFAIYAKHSVECQQTLDTLECNTKGLEIIFIELKLRTTSINNGCVYRASSQSAENNH